jgi:hypothetical protein
MNIVDLTLGEQTTAEVFFRNDNGSPLMVAAPPRFSVFDFNNALVLSGVGAQDPINTARWTGQFTIPSDAPVTVKDQRYSIVWTVTDTTGNSFKDRYSFSVRSADDFDIQFFDTDERLALAQKAFSDYLILPSNLILSSLSLQVLDLKDNVLFEATNISTAPSADNGRVARYQYNSVTPVTALSVPQYNCAPYKVVWTYVVDGVEEQSIHFLYAISPKVATFIHNLRMMIDKARNQSYNPALTFFDTDLIRYLNLGLSQFNSMKPQAFRFNMRDLPPEMEYPVLQCAAYNGLRAQLLAEGQAAFNFGGQSVTLDVDRTASIESEIGRLQSYIDQEIPGIKRRHVRSGRSVGGILGVTINSTFNWAPPMFSNATYNLSRASRRYAYM